MKLTIYSIFYIFIFAFLGSFILGCLRFYNWTIWALKFDHTATVTNFIITPLSFLSGVFYSIDRLPEFFQSISQINPFFYMIDMVLDLVFLESSDGSIIFGLIYLTILSIIIWFLGMLVSCIK